MTTFSGDTGTPLRFTLLSTLASGATAPINCSGFTNANFVLHLFSSPSTVVICNGGTWTVIDGPNGIVQYQPLSSEITVSTTTPFTIYLSVILPNGPKTMQVDTLTITQVH